MPEVRPHGCGPGNPCRDLDPDPDPDPTSERLWVSCLGRVSGLLISPKKRKKVLIFSFFLFLRSHISKKKLLLCMPKFSVMNFRILWSTKPNSTEIRRNINLYFPVIIELSVKSYGVFKVFLPNLS